MKHDFRKIHHTGSDTACCMDRLAAIDVYIAHNIRSQWLRLSMPSAIGTAAPNRTCGVYDFGCATMCMHQEQPYTCAEGVARLSSGHGSHPSHRHQHVSQALNGGRDQAMQSRPVMTTVLCQHITGSYTLKFGRSAASHSRWTPKTNGTPISSTNLACGQTSTLSAIPALRACPTPVRAPARHMQGDCSGSSFVGRRVPARAPPVP